MPLAFAQCGLVRQEIRLFHHMFPFLEARVNVAKKLREDRIGAALVAGNSSFKAPAMIPVLLGSPSSRVGFRL